MNKKTIDTYVWKNILPRWVVLLVDIFIVILSFFFACCVRFPIEHLFTEAALFIERTFIILTANILFFFIFKPFCGILRYSSFIDIGKIFITQTFTFVFLFISNLLGYWIKGAYWIPSGILSITYVLSLVMLICLRIVVKMYFDYRNFEKRDIIRIMIYAGEEKYTEIVKRLRADSTVRYRIRGFVSDENKIIGRRLMAMPVYANNHFLIEAIDEQKIDSFIVDLPKIDKIRKSSLSDKLLERGIKLKIMAPLTESDKENISYLSPLREIDMEDVLMREPIEIDNKEIALLLKGKRIMITGAAGSIGSEMVKQIAALSPGELILIDQAETPMHDIRLLMNDSYRNIKAHTLVADITNKSRLESIFEKYKPEYVFHAAAYKHIPLMENNICEAVQNNILGTCNVADLSVLYGVEIFLYLSTDKAATLLNMMEMSKRIAEIYLHSLWHKEKAKKRTKFVTVRFGNVLDSSGSVLSSFKEQIAAGGPITVTHPDIIRHFMTVREVALLLLEACLIGEGGETFSLDMGKPVKILQLAKRMISFAGYTPGKEIKIEFTGLRAGEKLYEERPIDESKLKPTLHNKIFRLPSCKCDYEQVNFLVRKMVVNSYSGDDKQTIKDIKTFLSKNIY